MKHWQESSESTGATLGGVRVVEAHRDQAAAGDWPADGLADLDVPNDVPRVRARLAETAS